MQQQDLIGCRITNIFQIVEYESYGLDTGECFIELDNSIIIDIPQSGWDEVIIKELDEAAFSVFTDLSDYPVYHINEEAPPSPDTEVKPRKEKLSFFEDIFQFLLPRKRAEIKPVVTAHQPYTIEYRENRLKYIKDSIIKDLITFGDNFDKGFIELENGYLISETTVSNNGTGRAGLNVYNNLTEVTNWKGLEFKRISDQKNKTS